MKNIKNEGDWGPGLEGSWSAQRRNAGKGRKIQGRLQHFWGALLILSLLVLLSVSLQACGSRPGAESNTDSRGGERRSAGQKGPEVPVSTDGENAPEDAVSKTKGGIPGAPVGERGEEEDKNPETPADAEDEKVRKNQIETEDEKSQEASTGAEGKKSLEDPIEAEDEKSREASTDVEGEKSMEDPIETKDEKNPEAPADAEGEESGEETANTEDAEDADAPVVALTFDDGPFTRVTNRIIDVLLEYDAGATFFVV
ncbi:MAG: polysaccharide deacetylase family protein, partial [Lachnospiraceae bacterium]|nr:polysaccharide deacetylase family protein [Lachnospiraceae bacterium]